jgi:tetratricopeptide (TPR) repeat protein
MRILSRSLIVSFVLSLGTLARAEEVRPYPECTDDTSDPVTTGARAAFQAGEASFNEADYPRAILYWEDAFRRACSATSMLLNLARAYELSGQKRQAVLALETYLQREPNSPEKSQIARRIDVLKKSIENEAKTQPTTTPTTPPPTTTPGPTTQPETQPQQAATSSGGSRVMPLVVIGVGGTMFILGGIVFLGASAEVQKYEKECPYSEETGFNECEPGKEDAANEALKRQQASGAISLLGLPVIAGGIIWYIAAKPKQNATKVTPSVGQNYLGLSVDGTF